MDEANNKRRFLMKLGLIVFVAILTTVVATVLQQVLYGKIDYLFTSLAAIVSMMGAAFQLSRKTL